MCSFIWALGTFGTGKDSWLLEDFFGLLFSPLEELLLGFLAARSPSGGPLLAFRFFPELEDDLDFVLSEGLIRSMPPGGTTGAFILGGPLDLTELLGA